MRIQKRKENNIKDQISFYNKNLENKIGIKKHGTMKT